MPGVVRGGVLPGGRVLPGAAGCAHFTALYTMGRLQYRETRGAACSAVVPCPAGGLTFRWRSGGFGG